jgi:hypothetical protein
MMKMVHPIGLMPSTRYGHCHAFHPLCTARSAWLPYAMRPLKEAVSAEVE